MKLTAKNCVRVTIIGTREEVDAFYTWALGERVFPVPGYGVSGPAKALIKGYSGDTSIVMHEHFYQFFDAKKIRAYIKRAEKTL